MENPKFYNSLRGTKINVKEIDLDLINKKILVVINEEFKTIKSIPNSNKYGKLLIK